jgi:tRNA-2-methylthio-N6-dimethylallyladenosine synthase
LERNRELIAKTFPVLVEGPARRGEGRMAGRTPQFKTAIFPGNEQVHAGDTVTVRIESATGHSLTSVLV